jgi:hypothetical protein
MAICSPPEVFLSVSALALRLRQMKTPRLLCDNAGKRQQPLMPTFARRFIPVKTIRHLTDAEGRSIAHHVDHLRRSLDSFAHKLRDAISVAVGETVSGTVQAALRAALADLAGLTPTVDQPQRPRYGGSYWSEADEWDGPAYGAYRGPPQDDFDDDTPERAGNRWPLMAFVGGRLLAILLRRLPAEKRWLTAAGIGLLVTLVIVVGLPGVGLFRSAVALTSLADILRGGVGVVSQLTS